MMKASEIRELTAEELAAKLGDLKKDLFNLRLQLATNQLDNTNTVSYTHLVTRMTPSRAAGSGCKKSGKAGLFTGNRMAVSSYDSFCQQADGLTQPAA